MTGPRPILALTLGDPAGIGPEVTLKALLNEEAYRQCIPVVIGDGVSLALTSKMLAVPLRLREIPSPEAAEGKAGTVEYISPHLLREGGWEMGRVQRDTGEAAFQYIVMGIGLAMAGRVQGVVTAPIHKEAINLAGHPYAGHTEIFSEYTGTKAYAMLLASPSLRVIHVTTHLSMRDACDAITGQRVLKTIRLAHFCMKLMGLGGKIGVAGLNAHCSENGLFGSEERDAIRPAIEKAREMGIGVEGPIPPDTVFVKAMAGQYDIVVAMYHDQGHIPVKLSGFVMDPVTGQFSSVRGVNCTVGLPIIRTSVDHGTAFDRAGRNVSREDSMLDALFMAARMSGQMGLIREIHRMGLAE